MDIRIESTSMVSNENLQRVEIFYYSDITQHFFLDIYDGNDVVLNKTKVHFSSGEGRTHFFLKPLGTSKILTAVFKDNNENTVFSTDFTYKKPLERTFYIMVSSHTDIGLHNSQYIQRKNCSDFIDKAVALCDQTENQAENDRYRYTIEGTWFWNNYASDRGNTAAEKIVNEYVKRDKIGVCCAVAGNHTQTYGLEEVCRSAYEKRRILDKWGISSETMTMIDNNGISPSIISPYCEAGYKNVIFSPNQWNPLPSTIWQTDYSKHGYKWNCDAGGGGARIDIRYSSELPMVFFWEDENKNRLLVWGCAQYENGSTTFGLFPNEAKPMAEIESAFAKQLPLLDKKYPYNIWLLTCYSDDQTPNMILTDIIAEWNAKWRWPKLRTLGNPDTPFNILRKNYADKIPVLSGDITGGWYQHPISAAELLAEKYSADRSLPTAEKWSVTASLLNSDYAYPAEDFKRAWDYLLFNDEHSYGTSGYQGRRVYETWMQHRDWIEKAKTTAEAETQNALNSIASNISSNCECYVAFNPTLIERQELIEQKEGYARVLVPSFGYCKIPKNELKPYQTETINTKTPPIVENSYYKVAFCENGSIKSIFDKELNRELLDQSGKYFANEFIYTKDNHKTFSTPKTANFKVEKSSENIRVIVETFEENLKGKIIQKITIPNYEKRIDIDNRIIAAKDMINNNRYYRYLYSAFPFAVENAKRICHLNGSVAEYGKDITGHGTDVYMAANEWCCCENEDFGIGLVMVDSSLVEFGEIHPDKTDFKNLKDGSSIFVYLANDWLQMHCVGGSHLNYRFRYTVTSYKGDYKNAKLSELAERIINPVNCVEIGVQEGKLRENALSFIKTNTNLRLLTLKAADDLNGIIARFYGKDKPIEKLQFLDKSVSIARNSVDEKQYDGGKNDGFITYRLGEDEIKFTPKESKEPKTSTKKPLPIGQFYTGLITEPKAVCGENDGQLYLLWGANRETNLSHYKLFRGEFADFIADDSTHIADVLPEEFVVGRYIDTNLKSHTEYFYRVCAVNENGVCGEISNVFSATTKEI